MLPAPVGQLLVPLKVVLPGRRVEAVVALQPGRLLGMDLQMAGQVGICVLLSAKFACNFLLVGLPRELGGRGGTGSGREWCQCSGDGGRHSNGGGRRPGVQCSGGEGRLHPCGGAVHLREGSFRWEGN